MYAIKIFLLELLLLFVLCFFGTIVMNVFGMVLNVDYSNMSGIKVGFCSWIILLMVFFIKLFTLIFSSTFLLFCKAFAINIK